MSSASTSRSTVRASTSPASGNFLPRILLTYAENSGRDSKINFVDSLRANTPCDPPITMSSTAQASSAVFIVCGVNSAAEVPPTLIRRHILQARDWPSVPTEWQGRLQEMIDMHQKLRTPAAIAAAVFALATVPGAFVTIQSPGVARADVCASAGRRVSVSGCADIAGAINYYAPPPAYYAPLPQDFDDPPPPPPPVLPNVSVCVGATGRYGHVSASGCR
jgi:hypothetical protein